MNTEQKRGVVSDMYSGPKWKQRVRKMSDEQVIAIYLREQQREARKQAKKLEKPR